MSKPRDALDGLRRRWRQPGGLGPMLALAAPLIVSTLSWTLMHFIDRVFLIWHSADAVAAALPAGALSFAVQCFPLGVAMYVNTFVAQYFGAERHDRIGLLVWQGLWLAALATPLVFLSAPVADALFHAAGHPGPIAGMESAYYYILCYGAAPMIAAAALSSFFSGRGGVRVVMIVDSAAAAVNVVLDYAWIFGHWGFPAWGIEGAAWATVVALWVKLALYAAVFLMPEFRTRFGTWSGRRFDASLFLRLLRYGAPNGVQFMFEVGGFSAFLLVVGRLGADELAATSLAINLNTLAFMPVFGIGVATSTAVGQWLGRDKPRIAARSVWSAVVIACVYSGVMGALYLFAPQLLLAAYATGGEAEFAQLSRVVTVLLRFVAFFCLFDAMNLIFASAIKGAGDTRFVLFTTLCTAPLPVIASWGGVALFGLGLYWCWIAITGWVTILGIVYFTRFLGGKWRDMRVIEPEAPTNGPTPMPSESETDEPQQPALSGQPLA